MYFNLKDTIENGIEYMEEKVLWALEIAGGAVKSASAKTGLTTFLSKLGVFGQLAALQSRGQSPWRHLQTRYSRIKSAVVHRMFIALPCLIKEDKTHSEETSGNKKEEAGLILDRAIINSVGLLNPKVRCMSAQ